MKLLVLGSEMVSEVDGDSEWTDADVGGEPETRLAVSSVLLAIDLIEGAVGAGIGVASESGCAAAVWGRLFRSEPTTKDLTNPANMVHTQHSRSQIHDDVCVGWEGGGARVPVAGGSAKLARENGCRCRAR